MANPVRLLWSIAVRNLGRNRRRTLIAGAGIALGVGMCIASFGVMDGMSGDMVSSITDVELGQIQLRPHGLSAPPKLDQAFSHARELAREAEKQPEVVVASPRVSAWVLASSTGEAAGMQLVGVDPEREARLTHLDRRVQQGSYLPEAPVPWPASKKLSASERARDQQLTEREAERATDEIEALGGLDGAAASSAAPPPGPAAAASAPSVASAAPEGDTAEAETRSLLERLAPRPERPLPILLGDKLARKLQAAPGTELEVSATDRDGNPVTVAFRVAGIVRTGNAALDRSRGTANLADVEHLLGLDDRAHELALRIREPSRARSVAKELAALPAFRGLEVKSWQELRPDVVAMVQTNAGFTAIMVVIIFAIAAIGIADTVLMAVFERRRELGVLKALGMHPLSLVLMIMAETLLLGVAGAVSGTVLGLGIDLLLAKVGIPLGGLSGFTLAGASIPPVLHAAIAPGSVLLTVVLMVVTAVVASLWPAVVAARVEPAVAMQDR